MSKLSSIVLFTFKPNDISDFLATEADRLPPFEITTQNTGHKSKEDGDGFCVTVFTAKPNQALDSLARGGSSMIPYYKSVCEKGHGAFSNAQMAGRICPRSDCGEKIFRENYYDIRNGEEWDPTPASKKLNP